MLTLNQARQLVPPPAGRVLVKKEAGITDDIITSVREVFEQSARQTAALAARLKLPSDLDTIQNVFRFVRGNIRYQLDPPNQQLIKTPSAIIHSGYCDCKGLAILTNSLLYNLGITSAFRYVSFGVMPTVTHVYALAFLNGIPYVLDACLPRFNQEKKFTHKQDHMTKIMHISGIGDDLGVPQLRISGHESEGEMDLKLHREGLQLERAIAATVEGIGSPLVANLDEAIADYDEAIASIHDGDAVAAIGDAIGKRKKKSRAERKAARKTRKMKRKTRRKAFFKKVGGKLKKAAQGIKKGVMKVTRFAAKAITLPARLFVKGLAEVTLPKVAPFFLYLFITNPKTIEGLPAKVKRKRKKAEKFAKFMTRTIGMKESHFMKILRNGIMRKFKASPEQVLAKRVKGAINGIGAESSSGGGAKDMVPLIGPILEIISKLTQLFGKKPDPEETPSGEDAPDLESDFEELEPQQARQLQAHLQYKSASQRGEEPGSYDSEAYESQQEESVQRQIQDEPEGTPADAPLPEPEGEEGEENFNQAGPNRKASGSAEGDEEDDDETESSTGGGSGSGTPGSGGLSKWALPAAGFAAYMLMKRKG